MGNDLRSQMKRAGSEGGTPTDGASDWNEPILPAGQGRGRPRTDRGGEAGGPLSERGAGPCHTHISMRPFFANANRLMQIGPRV